MQVSLESPICGRLQQLVGLRLKLESVLPRLQGKLDLVIGQVAQRQLDEVGQDALQIYEEGGKFFLVVLSRFQGKSPANLIYI